MWTPLMDLLLVGIVGILLAGLVAISSIPPPRVRAWWQQQDLAARAVRLQAEVVQTVQLRIAQTTDYWQRFQQEVLAELALAPPLPPPAAGAPDPTSVVPPLYLYHGTSRGNLASIYARGLEGRTGGWAFAARDYTTAQGYGVNRGGRPYVIFRIHAQRAYQRGVRFEMRGAFYVADYIHPSFLDFHWLLADVAHRENVAA